MRLGLRLGFVGRAAAALSILAVGLLCASCTRATDNSGPNSGGQRHHIFEGFIDYRGLEGKPPGKPFLGACAIKDDVFRCDITVEGRQSGVVGMRGSNICMQLPNSARWIKLDLATIGFLFSMLPPDLRHNAIARVQQQTQWTGRTEQVLGRTCLELETRTDEGLERYCYSREEFFAGSDQLVPVLHQMGYDNSFISSMSQGGIGWKGMEWDKNGVPKVYIEATRIDPRPVDPQLMAGVCR